MNENKDVSELLVNEGFRKDQVDLQMIILTDSVEYHWKTWIIKRQCHPNLGP